MGKNSIGLTNLVKWKAIEMIKAGATVEEISVALGADKIATKHSLRRYLNRKAIRVRSEDVGEGDSIANVLVEAVYAAIRQWKEVQVEEIGATAVCRYCKTESFIDDKWHASIHPHLPTCLVRNGAKIASILKNHDR